MRVLVVDDNRDGRKILKIILERQGFEVLEAKDGVEGLEKAAQNPDLIIADVLMPRMDGFEFLRHAKRDKRLESIPFIFYSATYTGSREAELALSLGAEAYIVRPKEPEEFWKELNEALEKHARRTAEPEPVTKLIEGNEEYLRKYSRIVAVKVEEKMRQLEESQREYRTLAENLPGIVYRAFLRGKRRRQFFNKAAEEITGYIDRELGGNEPCAFESLILPEDRARVITEVKRSVAENTPFTLEYRLRHKDGRICFLMEKGAPIYDEDGEPLQIDGVIFDITENRKAQFEVESGRNRIAAILKSIPDGLIVTDRDDRVILMNQAAEAYLGISQAATSGRHISSLLTEEALRRQIASVRLEEQEKTMAWERRENGAGPTRFLQAKTTVGRDVQGRATGTITLLRDITREHEIDRMKDEFISTAAHELRTPLTSVMGYLELLMKEQPFPPEERRQFLHLIYDNSEALSRIVNDLLDLSAVRMGRLITLRKTREDLAALVGRAISAYQGLSRRHTFRLEFPQTQVDLCLDAGKIGQVLENLLSNAVKFSPAGGTIRVSGHRENGDFKVTVADEGIGMRPEEIAKVFDKFYRADASDKAVSGMGLGMSITRNIVEAHGGHIWVESDPGEGTRVYFTLPREDRAGECNPHSH